MKWPVFDRREWGLIWACATGEISNAAQTALLLTYHRQQQTWRHN